MEKVDPRAATQRLTERIYNQNKTLRPKETFRDAEKRAAKVAEETCNRNNWKGRK